MKVELVSITKPLVDGIATAEELIVHIARVSNPDNQFNVGTGKRLLAFCIRNKHWSPFEMVDMTVRIETSRAIAQQILRHRSFSFQEFSQRYSKALNMESVALRKPADSNRQSSILPLEPKTQIRAGSIVRQAVADAQEAYADLLGMGVAKECARMVLPMTTQTVMYMKGSIRSWIHYLQVRCDPHVQLEHRRIAESIKYILAMKFPYVHDATFPQKEDDSETAS